jgi:hypothetical protein
MRMRWRRACTAARTRRAPTALLIATIENFTPPGKFWVVGPHGRDRNPCRG